MSEAVEFIYCACGCGKTTSKYKIEKDGRVRYDIIKRYINRHSRRGMKHSSKTIDKMSKNRIGKYNKEKSYWYGKKRSKDTKIKISKSRTGKYKGLQHHYFGKDRPEIKGSNNPLWKGDKLTTDEGLHYRIKTMKPKPEVCEICKLIPPQELSNKSGLYSLTDLNDWQWVCIKCHRKFDNNYEKNFKPYNEAKKQKAIKNKKMDLFLV